MDITYLILIGPILILVCIIILSAFIGIKGLINNETSSTEIAKVFMKKHAIHYIILIIFVAIVVALMMYLTSTYESRPTIFRQKLVNTRQFNTKNTKLDCKKFDCIVPVEDTYESMYIDVTKPDPNCKKYYDYNASTSETDDNYHTACIGGLDAKNTAKSASRNRKVPFTPTQLYLRDFFVKSAFNCCASGDFQNDWVNIETLDLAIRMGCRFLDFEIYTIRGEPCVAVSTNRDNYYMKQSFNELDLKVVLERIQQNALSARGCGNHMDPLFLHLRVKTMHSETHRKIARLIKHYFGQKIISADYAKTSHDQSPFSLPIEAAIGRVFVIWNNYAGRDHFPPDSVLNMTLLNGPARSELLDNVITTWSGTSNNTDAPNYIVREYLEVVSNDNEGKWINKFLAETSGDTDADSANGQTSSDLKNMRMVWPGSVSESNPGQIESDYESINTSLKKYFDIDMNDDSITKKSKNIKYKYAQIVPVCIQAYQKKSDVFMSSWLSFFTSKRKDVVTSSNPNIVAVGLRQRILKHKMVIVTPSINLDPTLSGQAKSIFV